jgi:hypothetical protein
VLFVELWRALLVGFGAQKEHVEAALAAGSPSSYAAASGPRALPSAACLGRGRPARQAGEAQGNAALSPCGQPSPGIPSRSQPPAWVAAPQIGAQSR